MKIEGHKVIFKALVGSHSYGTNIEGSDYDYKGVYIQDIEDTYVNGYKPEIEVNKDEKYFELGRFIHLCSTANPTVLELLFTPYDCIEYIASPFWDLIEMRQEFLTKACRHSFGGYAFSQIKKAGGLDKKMNWEAERKDRKDVLDFCHVPRGQGSMPLKSWLKFHKLDKREFGTTRIEHMRNCYYLYRSDIVNFKLNGPNEYMYKGIADEDSNDIKTDTVNRDEEPLTIMYFNLEAYQQHCKEYNQYQKWLQERNTQRYVDIEGHNQRIDGKNLLHCVRLLDVATEIAEHKQLNVKRPNAEYLIEIRKGKHDLQSILDQCVTKVESLSELYEKSDLPEAMSEEYVQQLIKKMKAKYFNEVTN